MVVRAVKAVMVAGETPPSVLPGISPSRGEIGSRRTFAQPTSLGASSEVKGVRGGGLLRISPLEGEMPGRAEGGMWPYR